MALEVDGRRLAQRPRHADRAASGERLDVRIDLAAPRWSVVHASAVGTSHLASGTPCQDRATVRLVSDADGGEAVVAVVCDGAGSAAAAETGAELVSETLRSLASAFVSTTGLARLTPEIARDWVRDLHGDIVSRARAEGGEPRDYACTLVFVLASHDTTVCGQIGDGAIVLQVGEILGVPVWPENGEYANETFFVSSAEAADHLQLVKLGPVGAFVLFSDGLQRLALAEADRTAHAGFFHPMVATVRSATSLEQTQTALAAFLQSDRLNDKTDDDKSIVIACRI